MPRERVMQDKSRRVVAPARQPLDVSRNTLLESLSERGAVRAATDDAAPSFPNGYVVTHVDDGKQTPYNPITLPPFIMNDNRPCIFPDGAFEASNMVHVFTPADAAKWAVSRSSAQAFNGTYSMRFNSLAAGSALDIAMAPGRNGFRILPSSAYHIRVALLDTDNLGKTVSMTARFYDVNGDHLTGEDVSASLVVTSTWTDLDFGVVVTPENTAFYSYRFHSTDTFAVNQGIYADRLNCLPVPSQHGDMTIVGSGHVKSSNFETGIAGWEIDASGDAEFNDVRVRGRVDGTWGVSILPNGTFADTTGWTAGTSTSIASVSGQLRLTRNTTTGDATAQTATGTGGFAVLPSRAYRFGATFDTATAGHRCWVTMTWYTAAGASISTSDSAKLYVPSAATATEVVATAESPATAAYAAMTVSVESVIATQTNDVDDAFVQPATTVTAGVVQTAASGRRLVIGEDNRLSQRFYTGDPDEDTAGGFFVSTDAGNANRVAYMTIQSPQFTSRAGSFIFVISEPADGSSPGTVVDVLPGTGYFRFTSTTLTGFGSMRTDLPGGVLGSVVYNPGTLTEPSTTSASGVVVDATNLSVTFVAPPSGVVVHAFDALSGALTAPGYFVLCDGSSAVLSGTGTYVRDPAAGWNRGVVTIHESGLTAGTSYTRRLGIAVETGGTYTLSYGGTHGPISHIVTAL